MIDGRLDGDPCAGSAKSMHSGWNAPDDDDENND